MGAMSLLVEGGHFDQVLKEKHQVVLVCTLSGCAQCAASFIMNVIVEFSFLDNQATFL